MKLKHTKLASTVCFPALAMVYSAIACAQLSTSLSQPLDTNLNGLDSTVAPTPSTQIESGANNLMTLDEHILPYDAIGASIVATPLDPSTTQYFAISRMPFQVDSTVKDVTIITGQHPRSAINLVDVISRRP